MASGTELSQALFECLLDCNDSSIKELADTLKEWKDKYPRTYTSVVNRQPVAAKFINAIEEALQLRHELGG